MAQAIVTGGYGAQLIASQLMINYGVPTLPLNRSFLIFGQRYVVDSHVFSNLVYDRVGKGTIMRMMPNPLDIAYAALGNDDALALLGDELAKYPYAPDLEAMRTLVDEHGTTTGRARSTPAGWGRCALFRRRWEEQPPRDRNCPLSR